MSRRARNPKQEWLGVLGERGVGSWVKHELDMEKAYEALDESKTTRPVSVRLSSESIALLDAFAKRFRLSRSGMLQRLIEGGLADAFHAMPDDEQAEICEAANASAAKDGVHASFGAVNRRKVFRVNPDGTQTELTDDD